jgi:hypothetical protein
MAKRKVNKITHKSSKKLLDKFFKYLDSIYLDVKKPASFTSASKLLKEVERRGYYKVEDRSVIGNYLNGVPVYGLYKPQRRRFPTPPVVVSGPNVQGGVDLMSVQNRSEYNDGINYLLVAIDDFSRVLRVSPLRNKEGGTVAASMREMLEEMDDKFNVLCVDKGAEFRSKFDAMLKELNIRKFFAGASTKCTLVEKVIKNLRTRIARYTEFHNTERYIDALPDIVTSYNNTYHNSIKMTPNNVSTSNSHLVFEDLYTEKMQFDISKYQKPYTFPVGSEVRVSLNKGIFGREYKERYSKEIFTVTRAYRLNGIELYNVSDCEKTELASAFYKSELTLFRRDPNVKFRIDTVHDEEKRGKHQFLLVTFEGSKCKEWVPKTSVTMV